MPTSWDRLDLAELGDAACANRCARLSTSSSCSGNLVYLAAESQTAKSLPALEAAADAPPTASRLSDRRPLGHAAIIDRRYAAPEDLARRIHARRLDMKSSFPTPLAWGRRLLDVARVFTQPLNTASGRRFEHPIVSLQRRTNSSSSIPINPLTPALESFYVQGPGADPASARPETDTSLNVTIVRIDVLAETPERRVPAARGRRPG